MDTHQKQHDDGEIAHDDNGDDSETVEADVARAGAAVAARRNELDLSQRHLAEIGIVSAGTLIGLEKGRRWPRRATRTRLEEALGWPSGHIARLRNGSDDTPTEQMSDTANAPLMLDIVDVALSNLKAAIDALPDACDPQFPADVKRVLADLRRIETSAARIADAAVGDHSALAALAAVRKTYVDLMLRAARGPQATLGQRVFAARHAAEISISELAKSANLPVESVAAAEAGSASDSAVEAALSALLRTLTD
jgi:transcriptional regulator with XRE-family HTH domain